MDSSVKSLFNEGDDISIYSNDEFICDGVVKTSSPYDVLIEEASIPIKYVGLDLEVRGNNTSAFGTALAFGSNCIDKNDRIVTVMVTDRELSYKHRPKVTKEELAESIQKIKKSDMASIPGMDEVLDEAEKILSKYK